MTRRATSWALAAVAAAGIAIGLLAEWVFYDFADPFDWVPDLLAGWVLIGCGLLAWRGRQESFVGPLLAAAGFTWFLGNFSAADAAWLAWIGRQGIYVHRGPLVHAVLTFPSGRPVSRTERLAVIAGYVAAVVTPVWRSERLTIGLAALFVALAVWRYTTAVAGERRARRTALWVAGVLGAAMAAGAAARLASSGDLVDDAALLAYQAALCVCAIGLAGALLTRPWDVGVTDLVVDLGEARTTTLRDSLARALGDPTLEVGYWSPDAGAFVNATGRPLDVPTSDSTRAATVIDGDGGPLAMLVHHPALLDDTALVESIGAAARLGSRNARLQAEVRAQIAELEASRRRIVTAADEEHRRLEERLRRGPEQRLEQLASRLAAADGPVAEIAGQLDDTLDELRTLAAGLHPRLLSQSGLAGALPALAARSTVPVDVTTCERRLPAAIEAAVYFVCSEALANVAKYADATHASIAVSVADEWVTVEIGDDGAGGADPAAGTGLRNLIDRVEAVGGKLDIVSAPGAGTRLVAELPLGDEA
jgi:signal transduction histidine kinase